MKKIIIYLAVLFVSANLYSQSITCNMYTFENGIKKDLNSRPYTGPCVTNYSSGKINVKGAFKNGLQDGKWETYTEDGKVESRESYISGKKDGIFEEYYMDEKGNFLILNRKSYKDDKPDGIWELYHNGVMYDLQTFRNGEKNGEFRDYDMDNGELRELQNIKTVNGKSLKDGIQVSYRKIGKNDTTTYRDDVLNGLQVTYANNGQLTERIIWVNGLRSDGIYDRYYDDGTLMSRMEYKGGIRNGIYEQYWKGKFLMKGTLKNDEKDGRWEEYDDDGKLSKKKSGYYENGKKVKNLEL